MLEHKRRVQCTVHMQCMLCWVQWLSCVRKDAWNLEVCEERCM